jgi:hypothetical protein
MDSLGRKHTRTAGVLEGYLMAEARDKKGVNPTSQVQTKSLNVSVHAGTSVHVQELIKRV